MRTSEQTDKIDGALLRVQASLQVVRKDKGVEVDRGGSKTKSRYATAEAIYEACHDLLVEHGITLWQGGEREDKGGERLLTVLAKDGQQRVSSFPILMREGSGAQNFGGGLAFAKRWGLQAAVGIFTSDDPDEANGYATARADTRTAKRAPAPAGIAVALRDIQVAESPEAMTTAAQKARAAYPTGESAAAVEKGIASWFCSAFAIVADRRDLDGFAELRDLVGRVKPRDRSVTEAMGTAGRRLEP